VGDYVNLSVVVTGSPLNYQWQFNGGDIPGATNYFITLGPLQLTNDGAYRVIITNALGSASTVARLRVDVFRVAVQPESRTLSVGQDALFTAQANSYSVGYRWQHHGTNLPGPLYGTLKLPNVQFADAGDYKVFATNGYGDVASAEFHLIVRQTDLLDTWTMLRGSPGPALAGITYGNGIFIAVSDAGAIFVSTNGTNWTATSAPVESPLYGVSYGGGIFVVVGDNGAILTSSNGVTWTRRVSGTLIPLRGVAYGNGTFVATGNTGHRSLLMSSTNGVTWNDPILFGVDYLFGIAYGNGMFVAVGYDDGNDENRYSIGTLLTSPDAKTWTYRYSATTVTLRSVAYGGGRFVAVGNGGSVTTSGDGITWTPGSAGTNNLKGVTYGNGRFAAVGGNPNDEILTSQDGTLWNSRYEGGVPSLGGVAYGNGMFIEVGDETVRSLDGLIWQRTPTPGGLRSIAVGRAFLVAVGQGAIMTSGDGVNWIERSDQGEFNKILFTNDMFLAVGNDGTIVTSLNGVDWSRRASGITNELHGVAYGNGIYVMVGRNGTVLTSTDAITWTQRASGQTDYLKSVTYGGGLFVCVGNLSSNVLTSTDGIAWTARHFAIPSGFSGLNLEDIAYGNGTFLGVGDNGYVVTSSTGLNWSALNTGVEKNLRGVAFASGVFVVAANDGRILSSSDGQVWNIRNPATGNNLRGVAYFNGHFLAVGNSGTIVQSGLLWPWLQVRGFTPAGCLLEVQAPSGRAYVIQGSSNLETWSDLFSFNGAPVNISYTDPDALSFSNRFYRVISH
ncbi:MAG: hypothetical protein JWM16_1926, partial [Verrucomicrobiales bacterium]|nr:hypothetical protein [Verrucomicrobiales bacterium]